MRYLKSDSDLRKFSRTQRALAPSEQAHGLQPVGLGASSQQTLPSERPQRRANRQGALLLVCLSLLVLFAVISITFVMLAGQYRRGSVSEGKAERYGDDYKKLLDGALSQVVRDVPAQSNPTSALADHSLLNDFGGTEVIQLTVGTAATPSQLPTNPGQIMQFAVASSLNELSVFDGFYNGCVLTMLDGPSRLKSARIVGYQAQSTGSGIVRVMTFEGGRLPQGNNRLIINGRPFNGAGFGYNVSTGKLDAIDAPLANGGLPLSLLPNHRFSTTGASWRGADEDYDAPDLQNLLLAFSPAAPANSMQIMPSLHRPDLINYLAQTNSNSGTGTYWTDGGTNVITGTPFVSLGNDGQLRQRQAMMRPHPADHFFQNANGVNGFQFVDYGSTPGKADLDGDSNDTIGDLDFTGKPFDPVHGPWDVDNDGDGIMDSVWVDLGSPVFTSADGRQYKPLYAILCVDLDGRLNVNAHGSFAQIDPGADGAWGSGADDPHTMAIQDSSGTPVFAGTMSGSAPYGINRPRGLGFGPAEIDLTAVFSRDEVERLFRGDGDKGTGYPGRYGEVPGGMVEAGLTGTPDALTRIRFSEFTNNHLSATPRTAFGTPSDVWGRGAVGLDLRGQPLFWKSTWTNEVLSNPYALNLSRSAVRPTGSASIDNPFTVAELERVLRVFDIDSASLPNRLADLPNTASSTYPANRPYTAFSVRNLLTTDGFDVPVPAPTLTREMIEDTSSGLASATPSPVVTQLAGMVGMSAADYMRAMLIRGRGYNPLALSAAEVNILNSDLAHLFDAEVLSGLRLNLNKPFGNGRDDNSNGVIDEPEEAVTETILPDAPAIPQYDGTLPFDHDNDGLTGTADLDDQMPRYRFAKQLFILAMMLRDLQYKYPALAESTLGPAQLEELTVRRIAQWAINVADFRDADAIITPFEYDINPFDGWSVDGIVGDNPGPDGIFGNGDDAHPGQDGLFGTSDDQAADFDRSNTQRRVVWGCESPELLLTETFAMHNRNVIDSRHDGGIHKQRDEDSMAAFDPATEDDDLDQALIPQGSAFFELYCTRNANNPVYPAELYSELPAGSGTWVLDLGRIAPADPNGNAYPVWRLAISDAVGLNADNDVEALLTTKPDSTSISPPQSTLDASNMSMLYGASATGLRLDRIVWFSTIAPGNTHIDFDKTYWGRGGPFGVLPGHYAVVGPRTVTAFGGTETLGTPSAQVLQLNNVNMHVQNDGTSLYPVVGNDIQVPVGIVVAGDVPSHAAVPAWVDGNNTADHGAGGAPGIGISISEPLYSSDTYYKEPDVANPNNGGKVEAYGDVNETDTTKYFLDAPLDGKPGSLLEARLNTGVQAGLKRTVFLQRLANPLLAWNPEIGQTGHNQNIPVNPYITVDWLPIECLVFNGLADKTSGSAAVPWDPQDNNPGPFLQMAVAARERGVPRKPAGASVYNLWAPVSETIAAVNIGKTGPTTNIFEFNLEHTLGYINQSFQDSTAATPFLTSTTTPGVLARYYGDPLKPFPYITFNNRPFANPLEVIQVPASGPDRLGIEVSSALPDNPYGIAATPATDYAPFRHLLNFFHDTPAATSSPHLARILDYLSVPSPFIGTDTVLNPSMFAGNASGTEGLHPPFNRVSNFREPGRININTISDPRVWNAVLNGHPGPTFDNIAASRRGIGANTDGTIFNAGGLPAGSPTVFASPFRGAGGGLRLSPGMPSTGTLASPTWPASLHEVDATLLRSGGTNTNNSNPLFVPNYTEPFRDSNRNSQFRYEELQRISGLTTTRSNVYAIWITVGYFEVRPAPSPVNPLVHPDGMQLVQELGADTGEINRHRAFYIYDRTIPVGFDRGKDLNVENGLLLKRIIE